jgi:hypothetical protein
MIGKSPWRREDECSPVLGATDGDAQVRGGDTTLIACGFATGASRVAVNTGNAAEAG